MINYLYIDEEAAKEINKNPSIYGLLNEYYYLWRSDNNKVIYLSMRMESHKETKESTHHYKINKDDIQYNYVADPCLPNIDMNFSQVNMQRELKMSRLKSFLIEDKVKTLNPFEIFEFSGETGHLNKDGNFIRVEFASSVEEAINIILHTDGSFIYNGQMFTAVDVNLEDEPMVVYLKGKDDE